MEGDSRFPTGTYLLRRCIGETVMRSTLDPVAHLCCSWQRRLVLELLTSIDRGFKLSLLEKNSPISNSLISCLSSNDCDFDFTAACNYLRDH